MNNEDKCRIVKHYVKNYKNCQDDDLMSMTLQIKLQNSTKILQESFNDYFSHELCISYNGGKDCTVLLHIYLLLRKHLSCSNDIKIIYFKYEDPFEELEKFVEDSINNLGLNLIMLPQPIKFGLESLQKDYPQIKAILMGNRKTDPNAHDLNYMKMTDVNWPQYMRIFPLLEWTYQDVWQYILHHDLPYCNLYNLGYTSLGSQKDTKRNPCLKYFVNGQEFFHPAYLLTDDDKEREGRQE